MLACGAGLLVAKRSAAAEATHDAHTAHDGHAAHDARTAAAASVAPAADSIYQLSLPLVDQTGRSFDLSAYRGRPLLVSMFYTSCQYVCPMLIEALQATQNAVATDEKARPPVLIVSFDPERDTVEVLRQAATSRGLDAAHWSLARTDAPSVRKLAAVLGIQYRALKGGDYNHTTALLLVDADGRIVTRTAKLGSADPAFVKVVKASVEAQAALR
jgi:protein SCO1/2